MAVGGPLFGNATARTTSKVRKSFNSSILSLVLTFERCTEYLVLKASSWFYIFPLSFPI